MLHEFSSGPSRAVLDGVDANLPDCNESHFVATNIQQLASLADRWLPQFLPNYFDMILVDEGHHNIAPSWVKVFERFPNAKVVSLTAMPFRGDGVRPSGMESRKAATCGFGRGRIISETTFVSVSHASGSVIPPPRRRTTAACSCAGPEAKARRRVPPRNAARPGPAREAVDWTLAHLSERDAVFARTELLAAALAFYPGSATIGAIERAVDALKREGRLHDAPALKGGGGLTTDKAVAEERETVTLMRSGEGRDKAPMRGWTVDRHLRKGPLTAGQKQTVKPVLSEKDRTVGVQGYAGTGKTRILDRARALAEKKG